MEKAKPARQSLICFLISGIVIIPILSGIAATKADTTVYLLWKGSNQGVGGYLEITDFPKVLTIGETYKITATFTVEELDYAEAVEFGKIEWALRTKPDENYTIGYSFMDVNITKHQKNSTISHWGFSKKPTSGGGLLMAIATVRLINSTEPDKTIQTISLCYPPIITLRVESHLRIRQSEWFGVRRGSTISLNGTLTSHQGKTITILPANETTSAFYRTIIELEFTDPKGHKTTQSTNTDFYGNFTFRFTPNSTGTWFITAHYNGSSYFLPSTSNIAVVHVVPQDPSVPLLVGAVLIAVILAPWIARKHTKEIKIEQLETKPPTLQPEKKSEEER